MSSSSDSDDERLFQDVSHRLNAARTPLIAALVVEGARWDKGGRVGDLGVVRLFGFMARLLKSKPACHADVADY